MKEMNGSLVRNKRITVRYYESPTQAVFRRDGRTGLSVHVPFSAFISEKEGPRSKSVCFSLFWGTECVLMNVCVSGN